MRTVLVMRQVSRLIDRVMRGATRRAGMTAEDVILLAWLKERQRLAAVTLGVLLGRQRQSVQRSLERLHASGLVVKDKGRSGARTDAWLLSHEGERRWAEVERRFEEEEHALRDAGVVSGPLLVELERLLFTLTSPRRAPEWGLGLVEPGGDEQLEWDG